MSINALKIRDMIDPELMTEFRRRKVSDAVKRNKQEMTANEMLDRLMRLYEDVDQERRSRFMGYLAYLPIVDRQQRICTDIARLLVSAKLCDEELDRDPKQLLDRMIGAISCCARTLQDDVLTWDFGSDFHECVYTMIANCFTLIRRLKVMRNRFDTITLKVAEENDIPVAKAVVEEYQKEQPKEERLPILRGICSDRAFTPSLPPSRPQVVSSVPAAEPAPVIRTKLSESFPEAVPFSPIEEFGSIECDNEVLSEIKEFKQSCELFEKLWAEGALTREEYDRYTALRDNLFFALNQIDSG